MVPATSNAMLFTIASAWLAASPSVAAPPAESAYVSPPSASPVAAARPQLGIQFDVGVPDGAAAMVALAPWRWLRLEVGAAHNGAVAGFRGGVTLAPFSAFVRPTLSLHAEHFPKGDLRPLARALGASDGITTSLLSSVQYDLVSAHAGFEIGAPNGLSVFFRAGVGRATARLAGAEDALREAFADPTLTARPMTLDLLAPSVQVGFRTSVL